MRIHYHGHSCFRIEHEGKRVLIDPFLKDNPLADVGPETYAELDAIVLTHGHFDHVADAVQIAKQTGALVVSNFEIVSWLGKQNVEGHPMHIGGGREFPFGHVKFTIAHHGSTGPEGEALGNPMGVVLTMGGQKAFHAGDTGVFLDMKLIAELNGPFDVAMLPIGDNFTMGPDDALKAVEFLEPRLTVPMHFDTFPPIEVDAEAFARRVEQAGRKAKVLKPGEAIDLG